MRETPTSSASVAIDRMDPESEAIIARLLAAGDRIDVPSTGGNMAWRRWGAGKPLVLLHGGGGSWLHWIRNIPSLAEHFEVWVPDLPGFGESDLPAPAVTRLEPGEPDDVIPRPGLKRPALPMAVIGRVLEQSITTLLEDQPVDVAGFSFGSVAASHFCARRGRDRVGRLVLCGAVGIGQDEFGMTAPLASWRGITDREAFRAVHRSNLSALMFADPDAIDPLAIDIQAWSTRRARMQRVRRRSLAMALLAEANIPTSGIWGGQDILLTMGHAALRDNLKQVDPSARLSIIEGAGHWVAYEAAEQFNDSLVTLLTR